MRNATGLYQQARFFKLYYSYVYECFACIFVYASCACSAHRSQKTPSTSPTSVLSLLGRISKHLEAGIYFGSASESENQTCGAEPTAMGPQKEGSPAERVAGELASWGGSGVGSDRGYNHQCRFS